jgi:outer membrane protein OmpA-like peptidoglycan-associated protein
MSVFPPFGLACILGFYLGGLSQKDAGTQRTCLVLLVLLAALSVAIHLSGAVSAAGLAGSPRFSEDAIGLHYVWGVAAEVALVLTGLGALIALFLSGDRSGSGALPVVLGLAVATLVLVVAADGWDLNHYGPPPAWPHVLLSQASAVGFVFALAFFVVALIIGNDLMKQGSLVLFAICAILGVPAYVTGAAAAGALASPDASTIEAHRDMALWTLIGLAMTGGTAWVELWQRRYSGRFSSLSLTLVLVMAGITFGMLADTVVRGGQINHPEAVSAGEVLRPASLTLALESLFSGDAWFLPWHITHLMGYALIIGTAFALLMRAFGFWKEVSFAAAHRLLILGFIGVLLNVFSGVLSVIHDGSRSVAGDYHVLAPQLILFTIGAVVALYFSSSSRLWKLRPGDSASAAAKLVAAIVLLSWAGVIVYGELPSAASTGGAQWLPAIHALGMALTIGLIVIIHLRLLGLFDSIAYTSLGKLFPLLWAAIAVQVASGAELWVMAAVPHTVDVTFIAKLVLVIAGFVLTLLLYGAVKREGISWAADTAVPPRYNVVLPSLVVWAAVLVLAGFSALADIRAGNLGTVIVEAKPVVVEKPAVIVVEPKPVVEEKPIVVEPKPVVEEKPAVVEPKPVVEEKPAVVVEPKPVVEEKSAIVVEPKPAVEEKPAVAIVEPKPMVAPEAKPVVAAEGPRKIIHEGGLQIIRHDPANRFRINAKDVKVEQRDNITVTVVLQADGSSIVTEVDDTGRLLRRIRRDAAGTEVILLDNTQSTGNAGLILNLSPPTVTIAAELYVRDAAGASAADIAQTLAAPPVDHVDRRYTLDEILYNEPLRARMPRVDIDTIHFETGSADIAPDQAERLALVAQGMLDVVKANPGEMFLVEGYTDAVGSDASNLTLSDRRAEAVAIMLTSHFNVPAENLTTQGYGKQFLKIPTPGPERANRRVAVRRITPLLNGQN